MNDKKCPWCKGTGTLCMVYVGVMACLNCSGTGRGEDGGKGHRTKPPKVRDRNACLPDPLVVRL